MPALALISSDGELFRRLTAALENTSWSVERVTPGCAYEEGVDPQVIAIDASEPDLLAYEAPTDVPVLWIVDGPVPEEAERRARDLVFLPLRVEELVARLDRLVARSPLEAIRRDYAKAFASMAPGVVVIGPDFEIVFANPRCLEIVGHRDETITADDIGPLISNDDLPRLREVLANEEYPRGMDVRLVRRDGTEVICSCSFAPLVGAEDHTVISFEEVTDQRETERELLKAMEFLESLIDASVDAIVATDIDQRVVLFNPSAEKISGRHVSDVLGTVRLEDLLGRSSSELVMQRLLSDDYGGEGRLEPTMLDLIDVYGERIPVQLSASLVYEQGAPAAIMLIFADLRDRIRVEERLAEAQKKLAFSEKQGVLAELAGTAAHELNQPLTSMMAYAELLQRQSEPESPAARAAEVLIREAERMADIVRKIGKITRYETTSYVGHQKIFDLDRAANAQKDPGAKS